jgi:hypothetical protein
MIGVNRHPVDRLADVRREICALEQEEKRLREYLLKNRGDHRGDEHFASVYRGSSVSVDRRGLAEEIGEDIVSKYTRRSQFDCVRVRKRHAEGEQIKRRRHRLKLCNITK